MAEKTPKTPFQVLHLKRLRDEFQVNTAPAEDLAGPELEAWILNAEDELQARLLAELREVTSQCPPYPAP